VYNILCISTTARHCTELQISLVFDQLAFKHSDFNYLNINQRHYIIETTAGDVSKLN